MENISIATTQDSMLRSVQDSNVVYHFFAVTKVLCTMNSFSKTDL